MKTNQITISPFHFECAIGQRTEPAWKSLVERWYQLDEASYVLCEAVHVWQLRDIPTKPDAIIFSVLGGSSVADADFVNAGANSPAKFVYTLPNVPLSMFCQVYGWSGPVYCLGGGENSLQFCVREAARRAQKKDEVVLVLQSSPQVAEGIRRVDGYFVSRSGGFNNAEERTVYENL